MSGIFDKEIVLSSLFGELSLTEWFDPWMLTGAPPPPVTFKAAWVAQFSGVIGSGRR